MVAADSWRCSAPCHQRPPDWRIYNKWQPTAIPLWYSSVIYQEHHNLMISACHQSVNGIGVYTAVARWLSWPLPPVSLHVWHRGSTCLHVPAGYAGISRWRHNMPAVVCRAGFLFVCRAFSPTWCHFQHLSVVPGALLRRAKLHPDPDRNNFLLITRYCFILCKELITLNSYLCIYNKNVARLSGIVARLRATTAILSRMCR